MADVTLDIQSELNSIVSQKGKKRKAALETLLQQDYATQVLEALLDDPDKALRKAAVESLAFVQDSAHKEAYRLLRKGMNDPENTVKNASLKAAATLPPSETMAATLVEHLASKKARDILKEYGPAAVNAVQDKLSDPEKKVRKWSIEILGGIGKDAQSASEELIKLLGDEDRGIRKATFEAIPKLEIPREDYQDGVIQALLQGDKEAASTIRSWGADAIVPLRGALKHTEVRARRLACDTLIELKEHITPETEFPEFLELFDDPEKQIKRAGLRLLTSLNFRPENSLEKVATLLNEELEAIDAVAGYGEAAIPYLERIFHSNKPTQRSQLITVFSNNEELRKHLSTQFLIYTMSEYKVPQLREALNALLLTDLHKENIAKAIDKHQDSWSEQIRKTTHHVLEQLELPTRESMWKDCALGAEVIRHLQRFGCTFESQLERRNGERIGIEAQMSDALFDFVYGVRWSSTHYNAYDHESYEINELSFEDKGHDFQTKYHDKDLHLYTIAGNGDYYQCVDLNEKSNDPHLYIVDHESEKVYYYYYQISRFMSCIH